MKSKLFAFWVMFLLLISLIPLTTEVASGALLSGGNIFFGAYNTSYNHTGSPNPTGIGTIPYGTDLNITWTNSSYSHKTVVVRKTGSHPQQEM